MNAIQKAEKRMEHEMSKWIDLNHCAMALSLHRYWNWGAQRIQNAETEIEDCWIEVAQTNEVSMLQLLEEETGIEIRNHEQGKSWHDLAFLNASIKMNPNKMNNAQWAYMRNRQAEWMRQQTLASILVGMHRRYGFGTERLIRLINQMNEIIDEECNQNTKEIISKAWEEVGFRIKSNEDRNN